MSLTQVTWVGFTLVWMMLGSRGYYVEKHAVGYYFWSAVLLDKLCVMTLWVWNAFWGLGVFLWFLSTNQPDNFWARFGIVLCGWIVVWPLSFIAFRRLAKFWRRVPYPTVSTE
jgi:uncharacterized membrane protein